MKKWILGVTVVSSLALGQFAVAEHRNHHDADRSHAHHDNLGHSQHDNRQRHNRYDRIVTGGSIQNVHYSGHYRHGDYGHRHNRHVHNRHCGHNRYRYRGRHGRSYDGYYGRGYRNHYRRNYDSRRHHSRHKYYRPGRRIGHVIRAY